MKAFALAGHHLSGAFHADLEQLAGVPVEIVTLPELRRLAPWPLLRRLRSLEGRCFLPIEDPDSAVLLPILEALAVATRARQVDVVRRDLTLERGRRLRAAAAGAQLVTASVDAQWVLRRTRRELAALVRAPRRPAALAGRRLLFLNASLWFGVKTGGSIAHVAGVVNALVRRDFEVLLATAPEPIGVMGDVTVHRLVPPRRYGLPADANLYRFGRSVGRQLRELPRPSFVYQRHSIGSYAGAVASRRHGVPLVLEYNGSEVWVARNWGRPLRYEGLALAAEEASLRHAQLVVTVSQALRDELVERGVEPERIVWHPNGVDPAVFDPDGFSDHERASLRGRYGIPPDAVLATFVGTFGQWHGADVLARAIRLLAEREPGAIEQSRLRFLLVGDGLKLPEVRREIAGLEHLVTLAGLVPQAETPLHLAASDVLVSPHVPNADGSPFFGSPTKLFEYMAAGKAIVASDLDQIGDVLRDGLALLVRPGDADGLARGLLELAEDEQRRRELGAAARRRVLERYTWDHHVAAVLEALSRSGGS